MPEGSVTVMIRRLRAGDRAEVASLWNRYFERLAQHAHPIVPWGAYGREDAALSAINDFCDGMVRGKFLYVEGREVLWATLARITERKALRGVRRFRREVSFEALPPGTRLFDIGVDGVAFIEPTPEYKALVNMTLAELIDGLPNPLWRQAVLLRLEGHSVPEIAARLGKKSPRIVQLWFRAIEAIWRERLGGDSHVD